MGGSTSFKRGILRGIFTEVAKELNRHKSSVIRSYYHGSYEVVKLVNEKVTKRIAEMSQKGPGKE